MEILVALIVIAFAFPLMVLASPLLVYVVPLVVIGLVISYAVRGREHKGTLWHWHHHKPHSH